jgi:hypothetical protein
MLEEIKACDTLDEIIELVVEYLQDEKGYCCTDKQSEIIEFIESEGFTVVDDNDIQDFSFENVDGMVVTNEEEAYEVCAEYDIYTPEFGLSLGEIEGIKL